MNLHNETPAKCPACGGFPAATDHTEHADYFCCFTCGQEVAAPARTPETTRDELLVAIESELRASAFALEVEVYPQPSYCPACGSVRDGDFCLGCEADA
tara:strand:+ start:1180 stop:1476 length:297 start_codon:yes stop_codon:yes gene_type:complete